MPTRHLLREESPYAADVQVGWMAVSAPLLEALNYARSTACGSTVDGMGAGASGRFRTSSKFRWRHTEIFAAVEGFVVDLDHKAPTNELPEPLMLVIVEHVKR